MVTRDHCVYVYSTHYALGSLLRAFTPPASTPRDLSVLLRLRNLPREEEEYGQKLDWYFPQRLGRRARRAYPIFWSWRGRCWCYFPAWGTWCPSLAPLSWGLAEWRGPTPPQGGDFIEACVKESSSKRSHL